MRGELQELIRNSIWAGNYRWFHHGSTPLLLNQLFRKKNQPGLDLSNKWSGGRKAGSLGRKRTPQGTRPGEWRAFKQSPGKQRQEEFRMWSKHNWFAGSGSGKCPQSPPTSLLCGCPEMWNTWACHLASWVPFSPSGRLVPLWRHFLCDSNSGSLQQPQALNAVPARGNRNDISPSPLQKVVPGTLLRGWLALLHSPRSYRNF